MSCFDLDKFRNPEKEHNIIYTWVWNMPLTFCDIDKRLEDYSKAGIGGLYILPLPKGFRPGYMETFLEPEYLSAEYFEMVKYTFEKAKEYNFELWLYDEGGWPSGGANGNTLKQNSEAAETRLYKRDIVVKKGENYISPNEVIASFDNTLRLDNNFIAEEDIIITEYYAEQCNEKHPNRVDTTNKSVIDTFINNTYEEYYKHFGSDFGESVSAFFTDEPSLLTNTLPKDIFNIFYNKYGYDVKDFLPFLLDGDLAKTEKECQSRIDYERLLGELFYENYCKNIALWCSEHNIRMTGHLDIDHTAHSIFNHGYFSHLHCLSAFHIPGIDVIWEQIRYPYDNRLPVEEGVPFFPRIASSASHQNGSGLAVSESFAVYGDGLTPDEMRYVLNYQAIRGINIFNFMLLSNSNKGASALGERPVFSPEKPGFYNLEHINKYYSRLSYLLKLGKPVCDTALYNPCADYWANNEYCKNAEASYISIGTELEKEHIPFDIIDDYAVLSADSTKDGLKVGDMLYKNIIIPDCHFIPNKVKEKISPYLSKGKPLITTKSTDLRVIARKIDDGILYFVFNQGLKTVNETIEIKAEKLYILDVSNGMVYKTEKAEVNLVCGDINVFYATSKDIPYVNEKVDYKTEINNFTATEAFAFKITEKGIEKRKINLDKVDNTVSGEIVYEANFSLPFESKPTETYCLKLYDTTVSARVIINGEQVATLGLTPMNAFFDGKNLKKENNIKIIVANTAANEIVNNHSVIDVFPKQLLGTYDSKSINFEKRYYVIKLGKVILERFVN